MTTMKLEVGRSLSLDQALRKANAKDEILVPAGSHRLTVCPAVPLSIVGESAEQVHILLPQRVATTTKLTLQDVAIEADELAFEVAGGALSLARVHVTARGSAVFVHGGGSASLRDCKLVSVPGADVDVAVVEVVEPKSELSVERGSLRGPTGAFVHAGARAQLRKLRITGERSPALRVHGARVVAERCQLRGGESGVYACDQSHVVLRTCALARSLFSQIEARASFVRVVGGTIVDGRDDGIDAHEGTTLEVESVRLRGNDIALRVLASRAKLRDVVVEDGRGAALVAQDGAEVEVHGGSLRAREPAALEALDGGVIRAYGVEYTNADGEPLLAYDGGTIEVEPADPAAHSVLDDERCWRLISEARVEARARKKRNDDLDSLVAARLVEVLAKTDIATITRFDHFVRERMAEAYRWDLWGVAYVMNGGCSDDGFDYFLGWLVGQGRERFTAALQFPELAAAGYGPDQEPFSNEDVLGIGAAAYAELTGSADVSDFYDVYVQSIKRSVVGTPFDEDEIMTRYPSLARFG